jgi:tetratricopeptide (TPR) repeat protein
MASRKRKTTRRRHSSRRARATSDGTYAIISYEITSEPLTDLPENQLPPDLAAHIDRLYHLTNSSPRDAIVELKRVIERYPDCPKLFNFLGAAYLAIGDVDRAEQIAKKSYERFPNYLFAKLAYADMCVCNGNLDEIPVIFDGKYDLSLVCPNRKRFHVTEAVGFMGVMGYYYLKLGDIERARPYHKMLKSLAPEQPQTQRLDRLMQATSFSALAAAAMAPRGS